MKNDLKRIAILALLLSALLLGFARPARSGLYATTAKVIAVDYETDTITVEDGGGRAWAFYGAEDWYAGDCASLVMDDAGTPEVYDDIIVSARYSGWNLK